MKRAIIESPYSGDIVRNKAYARLCCLDSIGRGEAPFAGHLLYTQFLDDATPAERKKGLDCDFAWMAPADVVAVYTDHGITPGMQAGIDMAKSLGIPVEQRQIVNQVPLPRTEGMAQRLGKSIRRAR